MSRKLIVPCQPFQKTILSALHADASTRQKVRRVSKYHVELEIELREQLKHYLPHIKVLRNPEK